LHLRIASSCDRSYPDVTDAIEGAFPNGIVVVEVAATTTTVND
jgi:hypothetical protein